MEALEPKSCTKPINLFDNLIGAMDEGILSWLAFLADEPESEIQEHLDKSLEYMNAVNEDLAIMQNLPAE